MHVACDIDGTADADPMNMGSLLMALRAAGHRVSILTGSSMASQQNLEEKANYLNQLGMGSCWDTLVVFADPVAQAKAEWCRDNDVDLFFDNNTENAKYASEYCTVMVPWNNIIPQQLKEM